MAYVLYAGRVYKGTIVEGGVLIGELGIILALPRRAAVLSLAA